MASKKSAPRRNGPLKRSGTRREGDDYQDIVAIDLLLKWLGSNGEFRWVKVEADDAFHLDDVTALRGDGTPLYRQVKYSTAPSSRDDRWDWDQLLGRKKGSGGKLALSLLQKWSKSVASLKKPGKEIDAAVVSNRGASGELAAALTAGGLVDYGRVDDASKKQIESQLGGEEEARRFFASFRFELENPGLSELEDGCRRRFSMLGGTDLGWASMREAVGHWVCRRDEPRKGGRISLPDIHAAARWHGLRPVPQEFEIPGMYVPPPGDFRSRLEDAILHGNCTVVTGAPGSGKSTFASDLFRSLRQRGAPAVRHHYYLPTPGELSIYQRADNVVAAESLMYDLKRDFPESLGALAARNPVPSPDTLRAWLVAAGEYFGATGRCLVVMLDGLDHVWTERQSAGELATLLGPILPPPPGVSLVLVTQPVNDDRLPPKLSAVAPREGWHVLPPLDERSTELWLIRFLKVLSDQAPPVRWRYKGQRAAFAAALCQHSKGHPLHLRYTVRSILDRRLPLDEDALGRIPDYQDEGISAYYRSLWVTLTHAGKAVLNLVTSCGFPLPPQGIVGCLDRAGYSRGDSEQGIREVEHLLEDRGAGAIPFHASLVVFVRQRDEHRLRRETLLRSTLRWLNEEAPEDYRWAYAWALEADLGEPRPLIEGLCRDWLVRAVVDARPPTTVESLISRGLWHAADRGDLSALVRIALVCDYCVDVFDRGDHPPSAFLPAVLRSGGGEVRARLAREPGRLHQGELLELARDARRSGDRDVVRQATKELWRRARRPRYRRRSPEDGSSFVEDAIAGGSLEGSSVIEEIVRLARRNKARGLAGRVLEIAAKELRDSDDGRSLRELLRSVVAPAEASEAFTEDEVDAVVREATLHALEAEWALPAESLESSHPVVAIYVALRGDGPKPVPSPLPPWPKLDRFALGYHEHMDVHEDLFRVAFFTLLANRLGGHERANIDWVDQFDQAEWHGRFLRTMDAVASQYADALSRRETLSFDALFSGLEACPRPVFRGNSNLEEHRLSVCAVQAAVDLSFDLAAMLKSVSIAVEVAAEDLATIRRSEYCFFMTWLERYVALGRRRLAPGVLGHLLESEERELDSEISELPGKSGRYAVLAHLAAVEGAYSDAKRLVERGANCLVAHGSHKDMMLTDVLRPLDALFQETARTSAEQRDCFRSWIRRIAAPLALVRGYTDGDETSQLPGELAGAVGRIAPAALPGYHRWLAGREEFSDAVTVVAEFLGSADLSVPVARAVAGTAVERRTSGVLEERADAGDDAARAALDEIRSRFGEPLEQGPGDDEGYQSPAVRPAKEPQLPPPGDFPPAEFEAYLEALSELYHITDSSVAAWARHWERTASPEEVLAAFERAYSGGHRIASMEVAYRISREVGDREGAFRWLVRAHRHDSPWYWRSGPEDGAAWGWSEVRTHYRARWLEVLRDTIKTHDAVENPTEPWRGTSFGHGGFERLVKYCLAVGERDKAVEVVDSIVENALQYVSPLRFPALPWLEDEVHSEPTAGQIDLLLDRLTWPSPLVRERACVGIASLLRDPLVGQAVAAKLAAWVGAQELESHQVLALLACARANDDHEAGGSGAVPMVTLQDIAPPVIASGLAAKCSPRFIVTPRTGRGHSGDPPRDFEPPAFFVEHARHFMPPLFMERVRRAEQIGTRGLLRQWAYEWKMLQAKVGAPLSTDALRHWFESSSYKAPCRMADPWMSEVYRSAYLRAISWAVDRGIMPEAAALFLASETFPVDLELWKIDPGRRPSWWPTVAGDGAALDTAPGAILERVKALYSEAIRGGMTWADGWIPGQASGRVSEGEAVYDLEIVSFLQSCDGPVRPEEKALFRFLTDDVLFPNDIAAKDDELSFRGTVDPLVLESVMTRLGDWLVLPVCGNSWSHYPLRWESWRLERPVWLPLIYGDGTAARFGVNGDELQVSRGDEVIGRWRDWTDGIEERLWRELTPPAGACLRLRRSDLLRLADECRMGLAWAVRITCHHRKDSHEKYAVHELFEVVGARTIFTV